MKKTLICLSALCSLFITSCSNDQELDAPQAPKAEIAFDGFVNKNSRGVTDITLANMGSFKVWGYQSPSDDATNVVTRFDGTTVNVTSAGVASYTPIQYWTLNNYYWFCGYATNNSNVVNYVPAGSSVWPAATDNPTTDLYGGKFTFNNGLASYTIPSTETTLTGAAGDADLIFAWNKTGLVTTPTAVGMNFKHLLSKVAFKFTNSMTESNIRITNLKVAGVDPVGTLDLHATAPADRTWQRSGTGFTMSYADDMNGLDVTGGIAVGKDATTAFNIFIPGAFSYTVTFTIEQIQGGVVLASYDHTVNFATPITMQMGNAYVFTADINVGNINPEGALQPIVFSPSVTDWVENAPVLPNYTTAP